jgi:hypothetical protein
MPVHVGNLRSGRHRSTSAITLVESERRLLKFAKHHDLRLTHKTRLKQLVYTVNRKNMTDK